MLFCTIYPTFTSKLETLCLLLKLHSIYNLSCFYLGEIHTFLSIVSKCSTSHLIFPSILQVGLYHYAKIIHLDAHSWMCFNLSSILLLCKNNLLVLNLGSILLLWDNIPCLHDVSSLPVEILPPPPSYISLIARI